MGILWKFRGSSGSEWGPSDPVPVPSLLEEVAKALEEVVVWAGGGVRPVGGAWLSQGGILLGGLRG